MLTGLSAELSINEDRSVDFPDFTNGKWKEREPIVRGKYCLDTVCDEPSVPVEPKNI